MVNFVIARLIEANVKKDLSSFPVVAILGPRQVGKTTLARRLIAQRSDTVFLDLERPSDLNKLVDAETYFELHSDKLICLDEIQLRPELFPLLRALIDAERSPGRFLILGSSSPALLRQSSETLAGRISYNYLTPFTYSECKKAQIDWKVQLWRGGFPGSLLAEDDSISLRWRENYIKSFLERDLRQFGVEQAPQQMLRLWQMSAHIHGQLVNYSKLGQSLVRRTIAHLPNTN